MIDVEVEPLGDGIYLVVVRDQDSTTSHHVTARPPDVSRLAGLAPAEDLIEASFRFLLEREPKESILSRFDLMVIGRHFPEYPSKISEYLR